MKVKQRTVCVCVCVLPDVTGRVLVLVGFELGMAEQHALPQRRLRYSQASGADVGRLGSCGRGQRCAAEPAGPAL